MGSIFHTDEVYSDAKNLVNVRQPIASWWQLT